MYLFTQYYAPVKKQAHVLRVQCGKCILMSKIALNHQLFIFEWGYLTKPWFKCVL